MLFHIIRTSCVYLAYSDTVGTLLLLGSVAMAASIN